MHTPNHANHHHLQIITSSVIIALLPALSLTQTLNTLPAKATTLITPPTGNIQPPERWDAHGSTLPISYDNAQTQIVFYSIPRDKINSNNTFQTNMDQGNFVSFFGQDSSGSYLPHLIAMCIDPFHPEYAGPSNDYSDLATMVRNPQTADIMQDSYNAGLQIAYDDGVRWNTDPTQRPDSSTSAQNSEQGARALATAITRMVYHYITDNKARPLQGLDETDFNPRLANGQDLNVDAERTQITALTNRYRGIPTQANTTHTLNVDDTISLTGENIDIFNAAIDQQKMTADGNGDWANYVTITADANGINIQQTAPLTKPLTLHFNKYWQHELGNENLTVAQSMFHATDVAQTIAPMSQTTRPSSFWVTLESNPSQPSFDLHKEASPPTGTQVKPGDTITYTINGTNTGDTILNPVTITDDLSNVLNNATITTPPQSTIEPQPTLENTTLTWSGALEPSQSVAITYTITLNDNLASEQCVANHVTGQATPPPPGIVITPPPSETEHCTPPIALLLPQPKLPKTGTEFTPPLLLLLALLTTGVAITFRTYKHKKQAHHRM